MYWYNQGFYEEKINENAIELSDKEYSNIMNIIGDGGVLKEDKQGHPYAEINEKVKQNRIDNLRLKREVECFPIINRGQLWYNTLTENQIAELNEWYNNWLDVTNETNKDKNGEYIIPQKPIWIK